MKLVRTNNLYKVDLERNLHYATYLRVLIEYLLLIQNAPMLIAKGLENV